MLKNMKAMALLILSNILISLSCAGTIDPLVLDTEYLSYAKDFKYVGRLEGSYNNGSRFKASAVAIDDHHILTAAHIVDNIKYNSCVFVLGDKKFTVPVFKKHKEFDSKKYGIYDIALGYSKTTFDLSFYPELYDTNDETGKLCCIAGYGSTGTFVSGAIKHDGQLRAGSNIVDKTFKHLLICSPSQPDSNTRTSLEFLISIGDSGGGLFIDGKLAGVNSCVLTDDDIPNSSYNDDSGHTRVSQFLDWIKKNKTK